MLEGQTPADLHSGREMGAEPCPSQSGEPDKRSYTRYLQHPQTEAVILEMLLDAFDHRITLDPTEVAPEEFHVESPGGLSPPGAPKTVHDPLESHGSRCSAVAMA